MRSVDVHRTEHGAGQGAEAADDHHGEELQALQRGEVARAVALLLNDEQAARQPGDGPGHREGDQMGARRVDGERLRRQSIVLAGDHRPAGVTGSQPPHRGQHDDQGHHAEEVQLPVGAQCDAAEDAELGQAVGRLEPREVQRAEEVLGAGHREGERRHRQERPADAQCRDAHHECGGARGGGADPQRDEHVQTVSPDQQAGDRAPQSHECHLAQRDVPGETGEHHQ